MPIAPKSFRPGNQPTKAAVERSWESRRNGNHAMYNEWIWRKPNVGLRAMVLARDPLCVECLKSGELEPSTEADHIRPHNGDWDLFTDMDNLQGLCKSCHSRKTKREQYDSNNPNACWWCRIAYMEYSPESEGGLCVRCNRTKKYMQTMQYARTVVCGPAGAGKTTYVRSNASANATVWDADDIVKAMTGCDRHHWPEHMINMVNGMPNGLVQSVQFMNCKELWIVLSNERRAMDVAKTIGAKVILINENHEAHTLDGHTAAVYPTSIQRP